MISKFLSRQEKAIIQLECQQLLNRSMMLLDSGRWEELSRCYTANAVLFRPSDSERGIEGREAIYSSFTSRPPRTSCHLLSNIVCDVITEEKVYSISRVWLVTGCASEAFPVNADGNILVGSFEDTLIRVGSEWLIQLRKGGIELRYS